MIDLLRSVYSRINQIGASTLIGNALLVEEIYRKRLSEHKNEFARKFARKYFSQSDEDGITLEIVNRIRSSKPAYGKHFIEFGVGDGCENNTLVLLSLGWMGSWFGGQDLAFDTEGSKSLRFHKSWIDKENIIQLYCQALQDWSIPQVDIISLDLDGNDYYFIECLLASGAKPPLFICEYNSIFPLDSNWSIKYDGNHQWNRDQYFGASLGSFVSLFNKNGYFLCACNPHTGANAFFIQNEYRDLFHEVPEKIDDIYASPFYRLDNRFTHRVSSKFIRSLFE